MKFNPAARLMLMGVPPVNTPPPPPTLGPLDREFETLSGSNVDYTSVFGKTILRVVALNTVAGASNIACAIGGTPLTLAALVESQTIGGLILAEFAYSGTVGEKLFAFTGNVGAAVIRIGDLVDFTGIGQQVGSVALTGNTWMQTVVTPAGSSDITVLAGSKDPIAYNIREAGKMKGQTSTKFAHTGGTLVAFFGHQVAGITRLAVRANAVSSGGLLLSEILNLKPIVPDTASNVNVGGGSYAVLPNDNLSIMTTDGGQGFQNKLEFTQLKANQNYNVSFNVVSITGSDAWKFDWCGDLTTALTVGAFSKTVTRASYDSTFCYVGVSDSATPGAGTGGAIEITRPVVTALPS